MNRIFISYRSSDGKKDADRLCADLSRLYGPDLVFFDKQDLRGGTSWRSAIMETLGSKPVVLLLFTPDLLGMQHPEGGRRIDHDDDPIRGEILTAHQHGALIVPLFTEGMTVPTNAELPEPLRFLKEAHALKLRTEDWANDLDKLVADLRAQGIQPIVKPDDGGKAPRTFAQRVQRGLMWVGGAFVALIAIGLMLPHEDDEDAPITPVNFNNNGGQPVQPPAPGPINPVMADISGIWWSVDGSNRRLRVQIAVSGTAVQLQTDPFPVGWDPKWVAYARSVANQGLVVNDVRYAGSGVLSNVMGQPHIEMPVQAYTGDGRGPLSTGGVVLNASANGQVLTGTLWTNGVNTEEPLRLVRRP
ncbi:toll/interleukin-1 receptor domain-containing protein [Hydrogenophaga sp.]|uniref:toll/interleukin-1 receptor domain-containing protein n=1 Tax=Hydrogenophaga sp. TaxID=1904254 RepID=UPI002727B70D|nr:toll/interleukin-1 receptor domain-containing protein [Hydrogenophaga sp.]MDO9434528.1 toll/interleukin-1 receptor domain-containing protein [Hydrogenophaga sp.]